MTVCPPQMWDWKQAVTDSALIIYQCDDKPPGFLPVTSRLGPLRRCFISSSPSLTTHWCLVL